MGNEGLSKIGRKLGSRRAFLGFSGLGLLGVPIGCTPGEVSGNAAGARRAYRPTSAAVVPKVPSWLSRYDLATQRDLYCRRLLEPLIVGEDPSSWPLLREIIATGGQWLSTSLEGGKIAQVIQSMMPVSNSLLPAYDKLVNDCARILHIDRPSAALISEDQIAAGDPHIYVVEMPDGPLLVISSKLLRLFAEAQDELRFLVGRELGRFKMGQLSVRRATFALQKVLKALPLSGFADRVRDVVCTMHMAYFLGWCRESEISADRAGLLCCQDREVAERAVFRLLGGLDDATLRHYGGKFDVDLVLASFEQWENHTFLAALKKLRGENLTCPYVGERIAALRRWERDGGVTLLAQRTGPAPPRRNLEFQSIQLAGLTPPGKRDNVCVYAYNWDREVFHTETKATGGDARWAFSKTVACEDGTPLFFEVWSDGYVLDELLGLFALYPRRSLEGAALTLRSAIEWNVHQKKPNSRAGTAVVTGRFA